ncbi:MAG: hypothetical protein HY960_01595 [Ignavibacteriae bacterium]|nr:hypothetical protein [Ignavibacteriota bacterium]
MDNSHKLLKIIDNYQNSRKYVIPLVASENFSSEFVRNLLQTDLGNRYFIIPSGAKRRMWDYPNQKFIKPLIEYTRNLCFKIFGGKYVSLSALSGNQCVIGIILGLAKPGNTVIGINAKQGGHWALKEFSKRVGVKTCNIPFDPKSCMIDLYRLSKLVKNTKPSFVMLDSSHTLFIHQVNEIKDAIKIKVPIFYDISHIMGLVGGGAIPNPLELGAACIHGSTHKTLFGPQKGLLIFSKGYKNEFESVEDSIHPILSSNIHLHHIAALAGSLLELNTFGHVYSFRAIENARMIGEILHFSGINVAFPERNFTETHQIWIPLGSKTRTRTIFNRLQSVGILVNCVQLPFNLGTGLRIGTGEITRMGYNAEDVKFIASLIVDVIQNKKRLQFIKLSVSQIAQERTNIEYTFNDADSLFNRK